MGPDDDRDISPVMFRSRACSGPNKVHKNLVHDTTLCISSIIAIVLRNNGNTRCFCTSPETGDNLPIMPDCGQLGVLYGA